MFSQNAIDTANQFQQSHQLDTNTTQDAIAHDLLHSLTGLSVSLEDEAVLLNLTNVLYNGTCLPEHEERVMGLVELMFLADSDLATEVSNFYSAN